MNRQGNNWECCLGGGPGGGLPSELPDQALCKPNVDGSKCPTLFPDETGKKGECKIKAKLTKHPRLLGMHNDTTTACFVSNENPKGLVTGSHLYKKKMFELLDQTVRAQPVSVLISGNAIQHMTDHGTPNRLMEKDVTGETICPSRFTLIMQNDLHWVALVGVTICDGLSSAWPCERGDKREYWKLRNSWGNAKSEPRGNRIHSVPTSGNEKYYAYGYIYMERRTFKNGEWNIINPCGLLTSDGYNMGGVVVPPIDGIKLVS